MPDEQHELVPPSRRPLKARPLYGGVLLIAMVGLRCVAGLSILTAFYGLVRGFWRLLLFFAGFVSLGTAVLDSDFGARLGAATGAALVPILFGTIGSVCLVAAQRIHARLAPRPDEPPAPVIYLRSFTADSDLSRRPRVPGRLFPWRTEEEQLVEALREMGRVIAIGRPGERLPQLGATRVYVEGEDWQQQVLTWFKRAALVVIHVPPHPTHGVTWEVERSLTSVLRARLVFLLPRDPASAEWITWKLREYGVTASLPDPLPRGPYRSGCSGFLYFSDHSHAEFSALVKPPFLRRPFSKVLVPVYRLALQPIITRVVGCWTPLAPGLGDASLVAAGVTFSALVIAFGLYMRSTALVQRDAMNLDRAVVDRLPAETRRFVRGLDQAALAAWMQSQYTVGLRYTPNEAVTEQAKIMYRLLTTASTPDCAAVANGSAAEAVVRRLLNELGRSDPTALRAWFSFRNNVLNESVASHHAATFPLSEAEATLVLLSLSARFSAEEKERFQDIATRYESATVDDQCWFARKLYGGVALLDEPLRSLLARAALGQETEK